MEPPSVAVTVKAVNSLIQSLTALRKQLDEIEVENRSELDQELDFAYGELIQWQADAKSLDEKVVELELREALRHLQRALRLWHIAIDGCGTVSSQLIGDLRDLQDTVTRRLTH